MAQLDLYRVFRQVAHSGSFSAAARELYISQPAVSQAIAQLEQGLGHPLLIRGRRGIRLTPEGEMLLGYVDAGLDMLAAGEEKLLRLEQLQEGELSIGASDAVSAHYLLPLLARFKASYPGVRLQVWNRTTQQALHLLRSGRVDMAFVNLPCQQEDLEIRECTAVHDVFVASPASARFAPLSRTALTPEELARQPLVMLERQSLSRVYVDDFFLSQGVKLVPEIELGAHDLLLEFAQVGLGVACVIQEFSRRPLESGALFQLPLVVPVPVRGVGLCTVKNHPVSAASRRFAQLVMEESSRKMGAARED